MPIIGSLNESSLHASLKQLAAPPGAAFEVKVDGYVVDAVASGLLIEVQTRHVGAIRDKLKALLAEHPVRLAVPLAATRWLVKHHANGEIKRRRSPKKEGHGHLFAELVYAPHLMAHPNFQLEVFVIEEEEHLHPATGRARRRRGWQVSGRSLVSVKERRLYGDAAELLTLLPPQLSQPFTTADLAVSARWPRRLAQQAAYSLHALGLLERVGKERNAHLYRVNPHGERPQAN